MGRRREIGKRDSSFVSGSIAEKSRKGSDILKNIGTVEAGKEISRHLAVVEASMPAASPLFI